MGCLHKVPLALEFRSGCQSVWRHTAQPLLPHAPQWVQCSFQEPGVICLALDIASLIVDRSVATTPTNKFSFPIRRWFGGGLASCSRVYAIVGSGSLRVFLGNARSHGCWYSWEATSSQNPAELVYSFLSPMVCSHEARRVASSTSERLLVFCVAFMLPFWFVVRKVLFVYK